MKSANYKKRNREVMRDYFARARAAQEAKDEQFRRVARELPKRLIAERLGITEASVVATARRLRVPLIREDIKFPECSP